jgi:hypothetical protein
VVVAAVATPVGADGWRGQIEVGVEYDSNVARVEEAQGPRAAPMARTRAEVELRGAARRLAWTVRASGGGRAAVAGSIDTENVSEGSVDAAVVRRTTTQLALGARATHYEVFPLTDTTATRAFASSGADLSATLSDERGRTAAFAVGMRRLVYKPDRDFDWVGPALSVAVTQPLWRSADDRAVDLAAGFRVESRRYRGLAYDNGCAPGAMLEIRCFVPSDRTRADLVSVATARVGYTGTRAASVSYELTVDDSTSFGASHLRQRLSGSVTTPLPLRVFATATVTGQLNRYPEPQLVARDVANQTFASLDDEARSSAALRLARGFGAAWQTEVRWAYHVSALGDEAVAFRRQLIYAGLTYER